jgi:carbamoyltransferase
MNIGLHDVGIAAVEIAPEIRALHLEEERLSRIKKKGGFPYLAAQDLASQVKLETVPQEQFSYSFLSYTLEKFPVSEHHSDFLAKSAAAKLDMTKDLTRQFSHHECHLFSILPLVREAQALVVVADGCGSRMEQVRELHSIPHPPLGSIEGHENISIYLKKGDRLACLKKITHHDLGDVARLLQAPSFIYERTSTLIFGTNQYAGKVMGLASLRPREVLSRAEVEEILMRPLEGKKLGKAEFDALSPDELQWRVDLAYGTQKIFQEYFLGLFEELKLQFPDVTTLAFVGGCALNCPLNTETVKRKLFKHFVVSPFPNDEGIAIGAALANAYKLGRYRPTRHFYGDDVPFVGAPHDFSQEKVAAKFAGLATVTKRGPLKHIAQLLAGGEVVAWIEGRSEAGPRALGHRSLLASPFKRGIKKKLNDQFKFREAFRPYGISVLRADTRKYFDLPKGAASPFMSLTPAVLSKERKRFREILQPDGSVRIQTVGTSPTSLAKLLRSFKQETGHGVLVHTSLNVMNEPIVETLEDAVRFFTQSPVRIMVIGDLLVTKLQGKKSRSAGRAL